MAAVNNSGYVATGGVGVTPKLAGVTQNLITQALNIDAAKREQEKLMLEKDKHEADLAFKNEQLEIDRQNALSNRERIRGQIASDLSKTQKNWDSIDKLLSAAQENVGTNQAFVSSFADVFEEIAQKRELFYSGTLSTADNARLISETERLANSVKLASQLVGDISKMIPQFDPKTDDNMLNEDYQNAVLGMCNGKWERSEDGALNNGALTIFIKPREGVGAIKFRDRMFSNAEAINQYLSAMKVPYENIDDYTKPNVTVVSKTIDDPTQGVRVTEIDTDATNENIENALYAVFGNLPDNYDYEQAVKDGNRHMQKIFLSENGSKINVGELKEAFSKQVYSNNKVNKSLKALTPTEQKAAKQQQVIQNISNTDFTNESNRQAFKGTLDKDEAKVFALAEKVGNSINTMMGTLGTKDAMKELPSLLSTLGLKMNEDGSPSVSVTPDGKYVFSLPDMVTYSMRDYEGGSTESSSVKVNNKKIVLDPTDLSGFVDGIVGLYNQVHSTKIDVSDVEKYYDEHGFKSVDDNASKEVQAKNQGVSKVQDIINSVNRPNGTWEKNDNAKIKSKQQDLSQALTTALQQDKSKANGIKDVSVKASNSFFGNDVYITITDNQGKTKKYTANTNVEETDEESLPNVISQIQQDYDVNIPISSTVKGNIFKGKQQSGNTQPYVQNNQNSQNSGRSNQRKGNGVIIKEIPNSTDALLTD